MPTVKMDIKEFVARRMKRARGPKSMNGLERRVAAHIEMCRRQHYLLAPILPYMPKKAIFEAVTLRLADGVRYTPDFYVELEEPQPGSFRFIERRPLLIEAKGFFRDDARVKFRVAAQEFGRTFCFVLVRAQKGGGLSWEVLS